jgi:hypothetical protein
MALSGRARTPDHPVLQRTAGAFDADGIYGVDVIYDPTDVAAPYRMYYSGKSGTFGGIGYATSTDGVTWSEYKGLGALLPTPVLDHGAPGSADSIQRSRPVRDERRFCLEDVVHGRRFEQEADRLCHLERWDQLGKGRQGDRARGCGL